MRAFGRAHYFAVLPGILCALLVLVGHSVKRPGESVGRVITIAHALRSYGSTLSVELADAPSAPTAELRVHKWLLLHWPDITKAAARYRVDPRAIAGVIAYEALQDIATSHAWTLDSSGPGKVHYREIMSPGQQPVAEQVEELGLLPRITEQQRKQILSTPRGAAIYIAAIMSVYASIAGQYGSDIRCRPDFLATFYSAWTFKRAKQALARHHRLRDNLVGNWVKRTIPALVEKEGRCRV